MSRGLWSEVVTANIVSNASCVLDREASLSSCGHILVLSLLTGGLWSVLSKGNVASACHSTCWRNPIVISIQQASKDRVCLALCSTTSSPLRYPDLFHCIDITWSPGQQTCANVFAGLPKHQPLAFYIRCSPFSDGLKPAQAKGHFTHLVDLDCWMPREAPNLNCL